MYEAVCINFILQLFWFLKATFCCNFYKIFEQISQKSINSQVEFTNFTNNFPGVGKSALRLLCFNASSNCHRTRNECGLLAWFIL